MFPSLLHRGAGEVLLGLGMRVGNESAMRGIRAMESHDGGVAWSPVSPFMFGEPGMGLNVVRGDNSDAVALWRTQASQQPSIALFSHGSWSSVAIPFAASAGTVPTIGLFGQHSLLLTWGELRNKRPIRGVPTAEPVLLYTVAQRSCNPAARSSQRTQQSQQN